MKPDEAAAQAALLARAFPKLEALSMEGDPSWTCTADELRALKALPRLREVRLTTTRWTDAALTGLLDLGKVERCTLSVCTGLTDACFDTLAKLRDLRNLEIKDCRNLTDAAIAAFQKARPDVTVTR